MMPILAPPLSPWCAAAALFVGEAAGGGDVGDAEGELVDEDVDCLAAADFTALAAAPAAPMKLSSGFEVVVASCAIALATLDRLMATESKIDRCIMRVGVMTVEALESLDERALM
jgi:hypothetical protein